MHPRSRGFLVLVILFLISWALLQVSSIAADAAKTSECVKCHTDVKGLIRLGWKIEKIKGKPAASAEIEGEG